MNKLITCLLSLALLTVGHFGWSISLADLQVKELNAVHSAEYVYNNISKALNLNYVGSSTESVVTITSFTITAYRPLGDADSGFGSSGVYNFGNSSHDTMGELCDAIEFLDDYNCSLLGAKRNDDPKLLRDQTAAAATNNLSSAGGYDVLIDTGGETALTTAYILRIGVTPSSGKRVVLKKIIGNSSGTNNIKIWGKLRKYEGVNDGVTRNDTTNVWSELTGNDSDKTLMSGDWDMIEFAKDAHVVIGEGDGGTDSQESGNDLQVFWMEK